MLHMFGPEHHDLAAVRARGRLDQLYALVADDGRVDLLREVVQVHHHDAEPATLPGGGYVKEPIYHAVVDFVLDRPNKVIEVPLDTAPRL